MAAEAAIDAGDDRASWHRCLGDAERASILAGWADLSELDLIPWEPRLYALGALARQIFDGEAAP